MPSRDDLAAEHHPHAVRRRLGEGPRPSLLPEAVLGGIDGCVTTLAVIAGALGGGFSPVVAAVLGVANLVADGFSMAVGVWQAGRTRAEHVEAARREEAHHVEVIPEGEREEVRQIFAAKGFEGEVLEQVVEVITRDRQVWIDTMLREEHGLQPEGGAPVREALVTYAAFVGVGLVPLAPFLVPGLGDDARFAASGVLAAAAFLGIGVVRGRVSGRGVVRSGLETLVTGGGAAALAFVTSVALRGAFGLD